MTATRTPPARVSALRALSILLAFTAAVGLIFGTAGLTAMEGDRGVAVSVADDENAYVGFSATTDTETSNNSTTATVEAVYQNQFTQQFTLSVTVSADGDQKDSFDEPIQTGSTKQITAEKDCSSGETVTFSFTATATITSGSAIDLEDRTRSVTC